MRIVKHLKAVRLDKSKPEDQADAAWLITRVLKPKLIHLGTPCTDMSRLGSGQLSEATLARNEFSRMVLEHLCLVQGPGHSVEDQRFVALVLCLPRVADDLYR